jgi:hypothetical protein
MLTVTFVTSPRNGAFTTDTTPSLTWVSVPGALETILQVSGQDDFSFDA